MHNTDEFGLSNIFSLSRSRNLFFEVFVMAYLVEKNSRVCCFLYAHHSFGRFQFSVDTLIEDLSVSKIHTIIEWLNGKWFIRDLSRNGTWLNHKRLIKDELESLSVGDKISFAGNSNTTYIVKDLSPPADKLIKLDADKNLTSESINLSTYNLLPEEAPENIIFYEQVSGQWFVENFDNAIPDKHPLNENDVIGLSSDKWLFQSSHLDVSTKMTSIPQYYISDLKFIFNLSLDEETTELKIEHQNKEINLQARSHHYLTLNLARYRAEDERKGIPAEDQGWVNTEQLVKDLGLDMRYLNIQIHRARKQFSEDIEHVHDAENIIERQLRKVRFAGATFVIYKGSQLESELNAARA